MKKKLEKLSKTLILIIMVMTSSVITSCAVAYYDDNSYKAFTYTKPEVVLFMSSFTNVAIDTNKKSELNLRLTQMIEYEKGKPDNEETTKQMLITYDLYTNYVMQRITNTNTWTVTTTKNKSTIIEIAFDILIKTESSKPRRP